MAHIQFVDNLIREYMVFRGFGNALKAFDGDLKTDKNKSFRVDKIIDQITLTIGQSDLQGLRDIWINLETNLFNKLEHTFTAAVRKLEQGILKLYLVMAETNKKADKVQEFFAKMSNELELHAKAEWKDWFYFPYCKNPEEHPIFAVYYTKQWQDTLMISLHNFLSTIFQCMPHPTLIRAEFEASIIKKLQEELTALRSRIQTINAQQQSSSASGGGATHQSRSQTFDESRQKHAKPAQQPGNLNDIVPFDISPPAHLVDDFYIIAQETLNIGQMTEYQARGLKSLIRNIGTGGSPVLGRKDNDKKKRSGSVGSRVWVYKE